MNTLQSAQISKNDRVFVRCDIDVPVENNQIAETFRLDKSLKTLNYIIEKGALPVIAGHMGKERSTEILKPFFDKHLGKNNYELLENLRFDSREKENSEEYAKELCADISLYVNESFATSHREHTSIVGIPKLVPAVAGFNLQNEINNLQKLISNPDKPLVALIGGIKLESKLPVVSKFLETADYVLLGGRLGLSWKEQIPENLIIPLDYKTDEKDIGPQTVEGFKSILSKAKSILWAGPMGAFETTKFDEGTKEIAQYIAKLTSEDNVFSVAGGGDTVSAIGKFSNIDSFSFVSTGGGAMLQFLANGTLPGIEVLN